MTAIQGSTTHTDAVHADAAHAAVLDGGADMDRPVLDGIGGAFLEALNPELTGRLSEGARRFSVGAGETIFPNYDDSAAIVASGITRTFLRSGDGRQLSIRYARQGSIIGTVTGLRQNIARLTVQAVTACEIVELNRSVFLDLVASNSTVAMGVINEIARRLHDVYGTLSITAFGSIRERIVDHLLELARRDRASGRLIAPVTQQALADSIGSVREVVARTLALLRDEGLIETRKGEIVLLDPERLSASVAGWTDR